MAQDRNRSLDRPRPNLADDAAPEAQTRTKIWGSPLRQASPEIAHSGYRLSLETAMPVRHLDAFFAPRSIGIMAESFAPDTHGGLALAALTAARPRVPVTLIGPAPAESPFRTVPALADGEQAPDLVIVTVPISDAPSALSMLGARRARRGRHAARQPRSGVAAPIASGRQRGPSAAHGAWIARPPGGARRAQRQPHPTSVRARRPRRRDPLGVGFVGRPGLGAVPPDRAFG